MAIAASVLSLDEISLFLEAEYGITADSIQVMNTGTANCYHVVANTKELFFKEFQPAYHMERAKDEEKLLQFLVSQNFPTVHIIPTKKGKGFALFRERVFQLQDYIAGYTPQRNALNPDICQKAAVLLARLHTILVHYPLPDAMGEQWLCSFQSQKAQTIYMDTLTLLENQNWICLYRN